MALNILMSVLQDRPEPSFLNIVTVKSLSKGPDSFLSATYYQINLLAQNICA